METAAAYTAAVIGVEGHVVKIEADISHGLPSTALIGLPDTALRETRDRVRAAIVNSDERWPSTKITVTLLPATLPKRGSAYDLAIAVAVLAANGDLAAVPEETAFLAELGLDGRLRPLPGVLPAALAAARAGITTIVVAAANHNEAALVPGMSVIGAGSLAEVVAWLRGGPPPRRKPSSRGGDDGPAPSRPQPDLAEVPGQPDARRALEVCAAGGHHLSLLGPAGSAKIMLAERLPSILPPLDPAAALEVTSIRSVAGMLPAGAGLVTNPPFCTPHHTASMAAIVGGGSGLIRPGAASLAHRGVLWLDQAPEFHRDVLDALRQPLESGEVIIARAGTRAAFPARFSLVLTAQPCPCAKTAGPDYAGCFCSPAACRRYLARLSGPLLDRIDVKVRLQLSARSAIVPGPSSAESSAVVAQRVAAARERAAARLAGTPWHLNGEVPGAALRRSFPLRADAMRFLNQALELGQISIRGADAIARVAWSLADLSGKDRPGPDEVNQAIAMRTNTAAG